MMIAAVILAALVVVEGAASESKVTRAKAIISKAVATESEPLVPLGVLEFLEEEGGRVHIRGALHGLKPAGLHGFHVHEHAGYFNNCNSAGVHYNPTHQQHGGPSDSTRHVGDLGNIEADSAGNANIDISDSVIALNGEHSVVGRSMVVHEKVDDLGRDGADSKTTGNAGKRLGCGIIGIVKEESGGSAPYAVQQSSPSGRAVH